MNDKSRFSDDQGQSNRNQYLKFTEITDLQQFYSPKQQVPPLKKSGTKRGLKGAENIAQLDRIYVACVRPCV